MDEGARLRKIGVQRVIRLLLPVGGAVTFFLLSLVTVRALRPKQPKLFFLAYAALLLALATWLYAKIWGFVTVNDGAGLLSSVLLQVLICKTMLNSFYILLLGFSGVLIYDLLKDPSTRHVSSLIRLYDSDSGLDRILARRLPNLTASGYIEYDGHLLRLRLKGRLIAAATWFALKLFSLGMGGGTK